MLLSAAWHRCNIPCERSATHCLQPGSWRRHCPPWAGAPPEDAAQAAQPGAQDFQRAVQPDSGGHDAAQQGAGGLRGTPPGKLYVASNGSLRQGSIPETLGQGHIWIFCTGVDATFLPMHLSGIAGCFTLCRRQEPMLEVHAGATCRVYCIQAWAWVP